MIVPASCVSGTSKSFFLHIDKTAKIFYQIDVQNSILLFCLALPTSSLSLRWLRSTLPLYLGVLSLQGVIRLYQPAIYIENITRPVLFRIIKRCFVRGIASDAGHTFRDRHAGHTHAPVERVVADARHRDAVDGRRDVCAAHRDGEFSLSHFSAYGTGLTIRKSCAILLKQCVII